MKTSTEAADLDTILEAYEAAVADGEDVDIAAYLPEVDDAGYSSVAVELIRVDMERSYAKGIPKRVEDYRTVAPRIFSDPLRLAEIAFEEYRLRIQTGEAPNANDYSSRFGVDTRNWPSTHLPHSSVKSNGATAFDWRLEPQRIATPFPMAGEQFAGFELIEELGRGAFGVVFRARQYDLAGREVVLKITARRSVEPQRLARLQHTNIVPIYSIHHDRGLLGICMPFLGRRTLADTLTRRDCPWTADTLADRTDDTRTSPPPLQKSLVSRDPTAACAPGTMHDSPSFSSDAAVEIAAQLAEGLAHAHGRGIVHSDLKPANVLMGDDGSALLLDFNLSDDTNEYHRATLIVGGTLPYMSPEQLRALNDGSPATVSGDVFSLGVILHELLFGERPFPLREGKFEDTVETLIRDRAAPKRSSGRISKSAALGAIVAKCLEFKPGDRYHAANELAEDLRRHQRNLPLKHAQERSLRERVTKWLRRNRRAARFGTIIALATVAIGSSAIFLARQSRLNELDTARAYSDFVEDARTALLHLHVPGTEPDLFAIGRTAANDALQQFGVLNEDGLTSNARFANLSKDQQELVREQSLALLHSLARVDHDAPDPARFQAASDANQRGADRQHQSDYDLPVQNEAGAPLKFNTHVPSDYLQGLRLLETERYADALPVWQRLSESSKQDAVRWFLLGNAYAGVGRLQDAESCYTAVIALQPRAVAGYFNRGICRQEQGKFEGATSDFTSVLQLRPNLSTALINRALSLHSLGKYKQAESDASAAIAAGLDDPRAYFVRALIRDALHDVPGAAGDRAHGFKLPPKDDKGWMARGIACLATDPE
ncbi:MAG TPA: serine/threonine-protein kinase, partial [Lacipirellulaceae bacterium]|nr:serine/threonine-protein kinase [Lacipirellulaceae bacterium]